MMRQSDLALVMATVALAYASSSCRLVPLGSHRVSAPWNGTLSTTMDAKAYVQCGLRRFPREGFRWCWFTETTLYLPPFKGVVPSQHSSILGVGPYCGLTVH